MPADTRKALIAHLDAAKSTLGLKQVKPYQGEFADAAKSKNLPGLLANMPAGLVLLTSANVSAQETVSTAQVIIIERTVSLEKQEGATGAIALAQTLCRWILDNHFTFTDQDRCYTIDLNNGLTVDILFIAQTFTMIGVAFEIDSTIK